MTHKDIYEKFMIEYDKANVTSSYPSLTEYEVATILDKAYNALIAQKVTGNNLRNASFESDVKSVSDLQSLISEKVAKVSSSTYGPNVVTAFMPDDFLYFVALRVRYNKRIKKYDEDGKEIRRIDYNNSISDFVKLVDHNTAFKFIIQENNMPWVKDPVCFIEDDTISIVLDPSILIDVEVDDLRWGRCNDLTYNLKYIKKPQLFTQKDGIINCFDTGYEGAPGDIEFECNNTVAEELISLAITFALENVESPRLNTKLNIRRLES